MLYCDLLVAIKHVSPKKKKKIKGRTQSLMSERGQVTKDVDLYSLISLGQQKMTYFGTPDIMETNQSPRI